MQVARLVAVLCLCALVNHPMHFVATCVEEIL